MHLNMKLKRKQSLLGILKTVAYFAGYPLMILFVAIGSVPFMKEGAFGGTWYLGIVIALVPWVVSIILQIAFGCTTQNQYFKTLVVGIVSVVCVLGCALAVDINGKQVMDKINDKYVATSMETKGKTTLTPKTVTVPVYRKPKDAEAVDTITWTMSSTAVSFETIDYLKGHYVSLTPGYGSATDSYLAELNDFMRIYNVSLGGDVKKTTGDGHATNTDLSLATIDPASGIPYNDNGVVSDTYVYSVDFALNVLITYNEAVNKMAKLDLDMKTYVAQNEGEEDADYQKRIKAMTPAEKMEAVYQYDLAKVIESAEYQQYIAGSEYAAAYAKAEDITGTVNFDGKAFFYNSTTDNWSNETFDAAWIDELGATNKLKDEESDVYTVFFYAEGNLGNIYCRSWAEDGSIAESTARMWPIEDEKHPGWYYANVARGVDSMVFYHEGSARKYMLTVERVREIAPVLVRYLYAVLSRLQLTNNTILQGVIEPIANLSGLVEIFDKDTYTFDEVADWVKGVITNVLDKFGSSMDADTTAMLEGIKEKVAGMLTEQKLEELLHEYVYYYSPSVRTAFDFFTEAKDTAGNVIGTHEKAAPDDEEPLVFSAEEMRAFAYARYYAKTNGAFIGSVLVGNNDDGLGKLLNADGNIGAITMSSSGYPASFAYSLDQIYQLKADKEYIPALFPTLVARRYLYIFAGLILLSIVLYYQFARREDEVIASIVVNQMKGGAK